jgi:hypothetical protein
LAEQNHLWEAVEVIYPQAKVEMIPPDLMDWLDLVPWGYWPVRWLCPRCFLAWSLVLG